jgi:hypothetical protein
MQQRPQWLKLSIIITHCHPQEVAKLLVLLLRARQVAALQPLKHCRQVLMLWCAVCEQHKRDGSVSCVLVCLLVLQVLCLCCNTGNGKGMIVRLTEIGR